MAEIRDDGTIMRNLYKISSFFHAISLILRSFFVFLFVVLPFQAHASFFSSIFGDEAYAQVDRTVSVPSSNNSQTMALLQANVYSVSAFQDKNTNKDNNTDENTTENIVSDNAILPATGPMGVSDGKDVVDPSSLETSIYVIRKGDSLTAIADMFNVSVNTILWANDMKKGDKLVPGDVLFILPISGLEHTVTKGQTLQSIAKLYKVDVSDIVFYNDIKQDTKLAIGDKLMIPGGSMADEGGDKPAANLSSAVVRDANYYLIHPIQNLINYFINPVPTGHKTQGLHGPGNRGIDIGAPTGTSIYASAAGTVLTTKTGCKVKQTRCGGGYGNMVIIVHPNGTKTLYGHMSKLNTKPGAYVAQGEVIGYVGNTGRSTGPHIHFEVFNAKNPGFDWSWAK